MFFDYYKPTFSRRFIAANTQYLRLPSSVASLPFTMACWFNPANANVLKRLMSLGHSSSANNWHALSAGATALIETASRTGAGTNTGSTTATYKANQWHHAAGVFASATSRLPYLDGGPGTEATASRAPTLNTTLVGALEDGGAVQGYHTGLIVWPAYWNVALSASDIRKLANGAHPTTIKPDNLIAFWDWSGGETEYGLRAAFPLVNTGTTPLSGPAFLRSNIPRSWFLAAGSEASTPLPIVARGWADSTGVAALSTIASMQARSIAETAGRANIETGAAIQATGVAETVGTVQAGTIASIQAKGIAESLGFGTIQTVAAIQSIGLAESIGRASVVSGSAAAIVIICATAELRPTIQANGSVSSMLQTTTDLRPTINATGGVWQC